jgi:hypothetical protein
MGRKRKDDTGIQLFSLRLPANLHRDLRHHAVDVARPLNEILIEVIEAWWKEQARSSKRR